MSNFTELKNLERAMKTTFYYQKLFECLKIADAALEWLYDENNRIALEEREQCIEKHEERKQLQIAYDCFYAVQCELEKVLEKIDDLEDRMEALLKRQEAAIQKTDQSDKPSEKGPARSVIIENFIRYDADTLRRT